MKPFRGVLVLVLAAVSAAAQQHPYSERMDVLIRNLDVVVQDAKGNAVRGLTKRDFIVLEEGIEQPVTNFAFYDSGATVSESFEAKDERELGDEVPPPRRLMFFIDEMAIHAPARSSLKKHAAGIVRSMRPGDLATIVRPTGATRILQDYSGDIAAVENSLNRAIDDCRVRLTAPAFAELHAFRRSLETASNSIKVAVAKREFAERERDRVQHRLAQIRALLSTLSHQPGKKVFILVTSGISAQPGRAAYSFEEQMQLFEAGSNKDQADAIADDEARAAAGGPGALKAAMRAAIRSAEPAKIWDGMNRMKVADFRSQIDDLARSAAADGIMIYALEPEVPLVLEFGRSAESRTSGSSLVSEHVSANRVVPQEMLSQILTYGGETLTSLTEKTGGRWFRGVGQIDDTFRHLADDLRTYYSLAYEPKREDANVLKIQVRIRNRPDLIVRTRTEVVARPQGRDMAERVVAGLLYPQSEDALAMVVRTSEPLKNGRKFEIPVELVIPVSRLAFVLAEDGTYRAIVHVHYAAARDDKELLSYGAHQQVVELSARQYAALGRGRYRYRTKVAVPRGAIKIALGVVDTMTNHASLTAVSVKVE